MGFENKSVIVTGAGSGIGRATALRFASQGAKITIADIRDDEAKETQELIQKDGGQARCVHCDVANEADVIAMTQSAVDGFGTVDILVSNAGISTRGMIHELSLEDWNRVIEVHLTGSFLCARESLRHMVAQKKGVVVTVGSISSVVIGSGGSAASYKAAKGGVLQFTRAIAVEYAHLGIRANCVCPGAIATNLGKHSKEDSPSWTTKVTMAPRKYTVDVPIKRFASPEEVANVITFAASDEASFVSGTAIMVDGGLTAT